MRNYLALLLTLLFSLAHLSAVDLLIDSNAKKHKAGASKEPGCEPLLLSSGWEGVTLNVVSIGKHSAHVLVPEQPATGRPWVIAHQLYQFDNNRVENLARTQLELLKEGFHVVAMALGTNYGAPDLEKRWDAVYTEMVEKYGLSQEVALMGYGPEGPSVLRWTADNPGKVSCLYLDNAVCDFKSWLGGKLGKGNSSSREWSELHKVYWFTSEEEALAYKENPVDLAEQLARSRAGIIFVTGGREEVVPYSENGAVLQNIYERSGLFFRVLKKPAKGDHSSATSPPKEIVRFIRQNTHAVPPTESLVSYGSHFSQVLDFWKAESSVPTPVVFVIHGGGWGTGTRRDIEGLEEYLKAGLSVVAVGYRFISQANAEGIMPPVSAPMHDVARALQFVRSKAAEWGIRKDRIGLTGGSAGGCTALWLAFHKDMADSESIDPVSRQSTRPYCVFAWGAQTTLDPQEMKAWIPNSRYGGPAFGVKGDFTEFLDQRESILPWIEKYSPYGLARSDAPHVALFYSEEPDMGRDRKDPTHSANFGVKLKERLRQLQVPCELVYPEAPDVTHKQILAKMRAALIEKLSESSAK